MQKIFIGKIEFAVLLSSHGSYFSQETFPSFSLLFLIYISNIHFFLVYLKQICTMTAISFNYIHNIYIHVHAYTGVEMLFMCLQDGSEVFIRWMYNVYIQRYF